MSVGIPTLPQHRLAQLLAGYEREIARRRRQSVGVLATLVILVVVASRVGEVDLANLFHHLSGLTSYFGRIIPKLRP